LPTFLFFALYCPKTGKAPLFILKGEIMKILSFENDEKWLKWRHDGIGGSDIPIIFNLSKYSKPQKLYMEKIQDKPQRSRSTYITSQGHICEANTRPIIELEYGKNIPPACIQKEYFRVSLDGLCQEFLWECKMTGKTKLKNFYENNAIPPDFFMQIQYQLMVSNRKKALLTIVLFEKNEIKYNERKDIWIYPDKKVQEDIYNKVKDFWSKVIDGRKKSNRKSN